MWKKILFDFPSRRYATHTHNSYLETTIVLHFLPAFLSLEPFFFQPGLSTHRSSRAAFDKPYTHAHTHTYPLSKRTVSAPFFVFLRDIPSPLIFATGFIYYADEDRHSLLFLPFHSTSSFFQGA